MRISPSDVQIPGNLISENSRGNLFGRLLRCTPEHIIWEYDANFRRLHKYITHSAYVRVGLEQYQTAKIVVLHTISSVPTFFYRSKMPRRNIPVWAHVWKTTKLLLFSIIFSWKRFQFRTDRSRNAKTHRALWNSFQVDVYRFVRPYTGGVFISIQMW